MKYNDFRAFMIKYRFNLTRLVLIAVLTSAMIIMLSLSGCSQQNYTKIRKSDKYHNVDAKHRVCKQHKY